MEASMRVKAKSFRTVLEDRRSVIRYHARSLGYARDICDEH